jgi:hypothetical protein
MDTNEITREPLERWERSPRRLNNSKACIWACAMRLMEAGDPDAPAHISMVGNRIGLPEREINDAIKNAARRARRAPDAAPKPEPGPGSDDSEIGCDDDAWNRPPDRVAPDACEVPQHAKIHGWPEDHPECADCPIVAEWFASHEYDEFWMYWVEKRTAAED